MSDRTFLALFPKFLIPASVMPSSGHPSAADETWYWPKRSPHSGWLYTTSMPFYPERHGSMIVHATTASDKCRGHKV